MLKASGQWRHAYRNTPERESFRFIWRPIGGQKRTISIFLWAHGLTVGIRLKRSFRYFHTLLTFQILKSERNKRIVFGQEEEEEEDDEEDFAIEIMLPG